MPLVRSPLPRALLVTGCRGGTPPPKTRGAVVKPKPGKAADPCDGGQ